MIVGIDEVGRGPWAGPLVVGAVILGSASIEGLTDSKKLSKKRREVLSLEIMDKAEDVGLGWVSSDELDTLGIPASLKLATVRALEQITVPYHEIIIDGTVNFLADTGKGPYVTTLKKADLLIASVSAASIVAKVARDDYMTTLGEAYPKYGFSSHAGYGTAAHRQALETYGVTPEHRRSFAPIAALVGGQPNMHSAVSRSVGVTAGRRAEENAAAWLSEQGYDILEHNWKTRFCEIDIVARKDDVIYFVEVKHRRSGKHGDGLAAITPRKLRQMRFAAAVYLKAHGLIGRDAGLVVVTSTGETPEVESLLHLT